MTTYNAGILGTTGPGSSANDGQQVNIGHEFYVTSSSGITEIHFWRADTAITSATAYLFRVDSATAGTQLASKAFTLSGTGWHTAVLDTPLFLTTNQRYRAVVNCNQYPATGAYWSTGAGASDLVSGPLTMPNNTNTTGNDQGAYVYNATGAFPTNSFNASGYWIDVTIDDTVAPPPVVFGDIGAKSAGGTTSISIAYPATVAAGDLLIAGRCIWLSTGTATDEAGWTPAGDLTGGTGTTADNHTTRIRGDYTEAVGGETGTLAFGQAGTLSGALGVMAHYSKPSSRVWDVAAETATDDTHGTNRSVTLGTSHTVAVGDMVVALVAQDTDTSQTITAPTFTGTATFGSVTRRTSGAGVITGVDGNIDLFDATVTAAGTCTGFSLTSATSQCGPVDIIRLRSNLSGTNVNGSDTGSGSDTASTSAASGSADTGSGADTVSVARASGSADTGSAADNASVTVNPTGTDTGSAVDAASVTVNPTGTDTGSGADTASVARASSASDTGSGADTATVARASSASDTATGVDTALVNNPVTAGDTSTAAETVSLAASGIVADTGAAGQSASVSAGLSGADTATAADTASISTSNQVSAADTAAAADTASVARSSSAADTATAIESAFVGAGANVSASDTASGSDSASVQAGADVSASDTGSGANAASVDRASSASDTASSVDSASVMVLITTTENATAVDLAALAAAQAAVDLASALDAAVAGEYTPAGPAPAARTLQVEPEDRTLYLGPESRVQFVQPESRTLEAIS